MRSKKILEQTVEGASKAIKRKVSDLEATTPVRKKRRGYDDSRPMFQPTSRQDWRDWLAKNHKTSNEMWVVYFKKHTKRTDTVKYVDMIEEALCVGWIDSTAKKVDDDRSSLRFTPRKDTSNWSEVNKRRARDLIKRGLMTEYGLARMTKEVRKEIETEEKEESDVDSDQ